MRNDLDPADLSDLLEAPIVAVLATRYQDGSTLLSPVWHEWHDGGFTVITWARDIKSKHLSRDPRATIVVAEQTRPFRGIEVRGEAVVNAPRDMLETARRLAIRYLGKSEGNAYADAHVGFAMELIRLVPGNLRAWDSSDDIA